MWRRISDPPSPPRVLEAPRESGAFNGFLGPLPIIREEAAKAVWSELAKLLDWKRLTSHARGIDRSIECARVGGVRAGVRAEGEGREGAGIDAKD